MQAAEEYFDVNEKEKILLCPAKQIGSSAKAWLSLPGFSGKVLAVLSTTIYFVSRDGEILWLSKDGLAMHRRCILASFRTRSIGLGQNVVVDGPFLRFSEEGTIDLDQAAEWEPFVVGPKQAKPLGVVSACTHRLVEAIGKTGNVKGFGQMIPDITPKLSSHVDANKQAISNVDPLLAKAHNSILNIATACFNSDMTEVTRRGSELIGLGPGLTPSGDDFLGGLLFAARSLKTAYPQDFRWREEPVTSLVDGASKGTHPISHTILRDHASGHGPEALHEVVASLLKGQDLDRTLQGVKRLVGIGETSGWDLLAGMLTGMLLVEGTLNTRPPRFFPSGGGVARLPLSSDVPLRYAS
jgi:hypothetical protein